MKIKNKANKFSKILSIMFGVSLLVLPIFFTNIKYNNNQFSQNKTESSLVDDYNLIEEAWAMDHTIIVKDTVGDVWSWGQGNLGQNGDGETEHNLAPNKITQFNSSNTIVDAWTMDNTIIAKDTASNIWSWGSGTSGQTGDGDSTDNPSPEQITQFDSTNTIVDAWTMANTIVAKDTAGDIWSWGSGTSGQTGDGDSTDNPSPEQITQFDSTNTIVDAWTMFNTIVAKDTASNIWSWGSGTSGQNGDGDAAINPSPEQITQFDSTNTIVDAWTMVNTIVAKDTTGNVWSWGAGDYGQNGDGDITINTSPEQITQFDSTNTIVDAWTMVNTIVAKDTNGEVWSWGQGTHGQNGDGEEANNITPNKITQFSSENTIVDAWTLTRTIIAKDTAGDIWSWGFGFLGQNGDGEISNKFFPNKIVEFNSTNTIEEAWTMFDTIIAKDTTGNIWSWGGGTSGQNGDGEMENNLSPEKIFTILNEGMIKIENITPSSATVVVEGFINGTHQATKATLTYGVSGGTNQTMDDTNLNDGVSFNLTGLTEGQSYNLSVSYFDASDSQHGSTITSDTPLIIPYAPNSGLSTGAIIGIAVGAGGAVLIGGGVGGFFLYKKKKGF